MTGLVFAAWLAAAAPPAEAEAPRPDEKSLSDWIAILKDGKRDEVDRIQAVHAIGCFGSSGLPAVEPLIEALGGESAAVRDLAVHALIAIGPEAIPVLRKALRDPDCHVRTQISHVLGALGRPGILALCDAILSDHRPLLTRRHWAPSDCLYKALVESPEPDVRLGCARALFRIATGDHRSSFAHLALARLKEEKDPDARAFLAEHLDSIGLLSDEQESAFILELRNFLQTEPDPAIRIKAREALERFGPRPYVVDEEGRIRFIYPVWTCWGESIESARPHADPYAEVTLSVTYTGPGGETIRGFGFWDGESTFRIRCRFPSPGQWTWRTTSSDPSDAGLHDRSGTIEVVPYGGENPLRRHGSLRVSANGRYLEHADGTPFLWIGDTAWAAPMQATLDEWKIYLEDRRAKGFTAIQIFCASDWSGEKDREGNAPFIGEGVARWNPAYWQAYDEKVRAANDAGFVVFITGLMEPVKRYPEEAEARLFARNLVARLMGDIVIFSPSFDSRYMPLGDAVGAAIREATSIHLISQHTGTSLEAAQAYFDKPYLDFCGLQSGAGWGSKPLSAQTAARNAVEWTRALRARTPPKPIIDLEARYDSAFNQEQLARLPRSCGYWTILSGAAGYTYGCAGVWNWAPSKPLSDVQSKPWTWREGIARSSSTDMKHMAAFFASIPWWTLEPMPEAIRDQPEDPALRMVFARSAKRYLAVAYLPDNASIAIRADALPAPAGAEWFPPATGERVEAAPPAAEGEFRIFARPAGWEDALLVVRARGS